MTDQQMMTERTAADYLDVSRDTLRRWRRMGIGPDCFTVGDGPTAPIHYLRTSIDRWLREREQACARRVTR